MLRFGPLAAAVRLRAPRPVREAVARRLDCVRVEGGLPAVEVRLEAERTELFDGRPGFRLVRDGARLCRHDFRVERRARGWAVEAVAVPESVEAALRVVVGLELLARGGLLVHASSVVAANARGYLFAGPSGSGKSTIAAEGHFERILCDELSLIAPRAGDGFCVWPSPFWGEGGLGVRARPAPLAAIWMLDGWGASRARALELADAALAVLSRSLDLTAADGAADLALAAVSNLVAAVPVGRLSWRRGEPLHPLIARPTAFECNP